MVNISTLSSLSGIARDYDRHVWHCFVFGMVTTTKTIIISKIRSILYDNVNNGNNNNKNNSDDDND